MAMRNMAFTHDIIPVNFLKTVQANHTRQAMVCPTMM